MIELLSENGLQALRAFVTPDTLFAFDLDGTLAPIVDNPTAAEIPETLRNGLEQLAGLATTAVITGRSRSDALPRLGFNPHYLVGNHGSEGLPGLEDQGLHLQVLIGQWLEQLHRILPPDSWSNLFVERKSSSLSLHYRHAQDRSATHQSLMAAIARLDPPPRRVGGKFVENLQPPLAPHKGDALLLLMEHSGCPKALFFGDDETDEDIFRLADARIFSVCIGTDRPTAADYHLHNQHDMAQALEQLIQLVRKIRGTGQITARSCTTCS